MMQLLIVFIFCFIININSIFAACDCGSTDINNPCTGQSIAVNVIAGTPNGGSPVNSQYNWSFNSGGGDAKCGQFANGDYWIAPAAGKTSVTITAITGLGSISADADPIPETTGILGVSNKYGNYVESENIISKLPITYSTITSLVAATQRNETLEGACGTSAIVGACVDSYNIVTILPSVPGNCGSDAIRPNITGTSKELLKLSDFDFSKIPAKTFLNGFTPDQLETIRQRWTHSTEIYGVFNATRAAGWSEGGRAFRSHILIDDYGAGTATVWWNDVMGLLSDDNSISDKTKAMAAILTYGHDIYKAVYDPPPGVTRWFGVGATQSAGRFPPAVLFAALLKDKTKASLIRTAGINGRSLPSIGPHELTQVQRGKSFPVWGDAIYGDLEEGAYWGNVLKSQCYDGATGTCNTTIGKRTGRDPHGYIDGPPNVPGSSYMGSSLGPQRSLAALMYLMPEVCEAVNYDEMLEYIDRLQNYGVKTATDPCVTPDSRENLETCDPYRDTGCSYYKVTWGPNPNTPGDCIKNPTIPYTKVGRFTNADKKTVGAVYTSGQVESNWSTIKGSQIMCQRPTSPMPSPIIFKLNLNQ